jgi:hypothetical protein
MRGALVIEPLPRDARDVTAVRALAFDQASNLLFAAIGHRVQFGMRIWSDRVKNWLREPFKRFAFNGRSHLAFKAETLRHCPKRPLVAVLNPDRGMYQFMGRMPATRIPSAITGEMMISW